MNELSFTLCNFSDKMSVLVWPPNKNKHPQQKPLHPICKDSSLFASASIESKCKSGRFLVTLQEWIPDMSKYTNIKMKCTQIQYFMTIKLSMGWIICTAHEL